MNEVIGRKKSGIGLPFYIITIALALWLVHEVTHGNSVEMGIWLIVFLLFAAMSFMYLSVPDELVTLLDEHTILLLNKEFVFLTDVDEVTTNRSEHSSAKFGTLTIRTPLKTYKLRFLSNCLEVAAYLRILSANEKNNFVNNMTRVAKSVPVPVFTSFATAAPVAPVAPAAPVEPAATAAPVKPAAPAAPVVHIAPADVIAPTTSDDPYAPAVIFAPYTPAEPETPAKPAEKKAEKKDEKKADAAEKPAEKPEGEPAAE